MIREALGVLLAFLVLGVIGLGPAVWLVSASPKRVIYALGIAPALGYALIALTGFPLSRYLSAVRDWAISVTLLFAVVSLALTVWNWRVHRADYRLAADRRASWFLIGFILLGYLALVSPMVWGGIQYAIYRANNSDSFVFMSLAETSRVVDWQTLQGGAALTQDNLSGIRKLAEASPTALFAARFLLRAFSLNGTTAFAWMAEILSIPIYRFYYGYHALSLLLGLPVTLVIANQLKLPKVLQYLAAGAVAIGFWAKFILENDAVSEIAVLPMVLLFVFAWIQLEQEPLRPLSPARVLLALVGVVIVRVYNPQVIIIVAAFAFYYILGFLQKVKPFTAILYHGITLVLALAIILFTGQMDVFIGDTLFLTTSAYAIEKRAYPVQLELIRTNGPAAVWGLPVSILFAGLSRNRSLLLQFVTNAIAVAMTAAVILAFVALVRKMAVTAERVILSIVAGGLFISILAYALNDPRDTGKALSYIYPYLILAAMIALNYLPLFRRRNLHRYATALLGGWLCLQILVGLFLPNNRALNATFNLGPKKSNYNVDSIVQFLDQHPPRLLLVDVPRDKDWVFAFYAMFVFSKYPAYFQSGIIVDNNETYQNLWLAELTRAPDYAVTLKSADHIGPEHLGTPVAESPELVLYRLNTTDVTVFREKEKLFRQQEATKPFFPTWGN